MSEGLPYANGRYVPNMRHAFKFGASVAGLLQEGIAALQVTQTRKEAPMHKSIYHLVVKE